MNRRPLECRIIVTYGNRVDRKVEVGMYCPVTRRYEPLGAHGPDQDTVDRVIRDLRVRIERERHDVTWSVMRGPR